ncbi:MAG: hypothetical protein GFH27_549309n152 [Chloroflexi bacterium AL-W]|nr:hypothetical protein [Chloroflexi bacterium AL-N1]NOK69854.1 hypothetical protein [Chloroflexi bacterium AL-N10]NOK73542.1 hypothetical protein [Chloroflexi bacterium AL-N5]NOK84024.1 hypothetical protein [Chloroflexi bacterium AL-W]NOK87873.1 hypothetical protein [Chloroflexi bacterium AL-N15]
MMSESTTKNDIPACRMGHTAEDLAREADRAVLYGAVLAAQRPNVRLKPKVVEAAQALLPAVKAFLEGRDDEDARYALEYARACGGEAFLLQKQKTFMR